MREQPQADDSELEEGPSKTALKREMTERQRLGEALTELNDKQLGKIPIDNGQLLAAIVETRNIRSKNARKRHLQFIGKLMRDVDPEPIQIALEQLHKPATQKNARFHELEQMRDEMLAAGQAGVEQIVQRWPDADRQQLRQLLLQHQREIQRGKPPAASRKLFRYLRELQELYGDSD